MCGDVSLRNYHVGLVLFLFITTPTTGVDNVLRYAVGGGVGSAVSYASVCPYHLATYLRGV